MQCGVISFAVVFIWICVFKLYQVAFPSVGYINKIFIVRPFVENTTFNPFIGSSAYALSGLVTNYIWKTCQGRLVRLICPNIMLLVQAGPDENLKDVSIKILQSGVAALPIIHSSSDEGLYPQLLYLASLPEILKCKNLKNFKSDDRNLLTDVGFANFRYMQVF